MAAHRQVQSWAARATCLQMPWEAGACRVLVMVARLPRLLSGLPDALS
jgi:hypothetical protein